jgi:hypothetical protein
MCPLKYSKSKVFSSPATLPSLLILQTGFDMEILNIYFKGKINISPKLQDSLLCSLHCERSIQHAVRKAPFVITPNKHFY